MGDQSQGAQAAQPVQALQDQRASSETGSRYACGSSARTAPGYQDIIVGKKWYAAHLYGFACRALHGPQERFRKTKARRLFGLSRMAGQRPRHKRKIKHPFGGHPSRTAPQGQLTGHRVQCRRPVVREWQQSVGHDHPAVQTDELLFSQLAQVVFQLAGARQALVKRIDEGVRAVDDTRIVRPFPILKIRGEPCFQSGARRR